MKNEDKKLLFKDLSARLPYGVKIEGYKLPCIILDSDWLHFMYTHQEFAIRRPYLRPMSSMTEEEKEEYRGTLIALPDEEYLISTMRTIDWLNAHHFDYRGLIEKGLAIEVTKDNNPYE